MATVRHYPHSYGSNPIYTPVHVRGIGFVVAAVVIFSAFVVFISLWERDHSLLLAAGNQLGQDFVRPSVAQPPTTVSADSQPSTDSVTRVMVPTSIATPAVVPVGTPGHTELLGTEKHGARRFVEFTLSRSRRFQQVGPVSLYIWKVDSKHKLYDISVLSDGHRLDRKRVSLDSPLRISSNQFSQPVEIVVNDIARNSISGYVSEPKSAH